MASPFFRSLDLSALGVVLRQPEVPFAHPLGGGRAAALYRDVGETASHLGGDAAAYRDLVGPLVDWLDRIVDYVLGPMRSVPRDPLALARFALAGTPSVRHATRGFTTDAARALLAGAAAHSMQELTAPLTSAFGLLLTALGHGVGWPVVEGGSAAITSGLASELRRLGGVIRTGSWVTSLADLPPSRAVLLDTSPRHSWPWRGPVSPNGRVARGAVQARARRLQGGLGARRAGALERRRPAGAP